MANFTALKTAIQNAIRQNGNEEITGNVLQQILLSVVDTMGDGAINTIEQNLSNETLARQNGDNTLQSNINAEALARENADTQLQSNINSEAGARQSADTQLQNAINSEGTARGNADTVLQGNIETERNARIAADNILDGKIATEKNQRIAAVDSLNAAITAINDSVKNGYVYAGIAQPSSAPTTGKVFYVATTAGQYVNFSNIQVPAGINILKKVGSTWVSEFVFNSDALMAEIVSFEEQVRTLLEDYQPIIINGDVVNAPDEVDITAQPDGLLKFKDKAYDPLVFSGMGRKYLRKNIRPEVDSVDFDGFVEDVPTEDSLTGTPDSIWWDRINEVFVGKKDDVYYLAWTDDDSFVPASTELIYMYDGNPYRWNGTEFYVDEDVVPTLKNILTQAMLTQQNTIYVIQYDFTLGEDITVPDNCVLEFDGGSISGEHTITGQNTCIQAGLVKIFNTDITLAGTWNVAEAYPEWFGAKGNRVADDTDSIQKCINSFIRIRISKVFKVSHPIRIQGYKIIEGNNIKNQINAGFDALSSFETTTVTKNGHTETISSIFYGVDSGDNIKLTNCCLDGHYKVASCVCGHPYGYFSFLVEGCFIRRFYGAAIYAVASDMATVINNTIMYCYIAVYASLMYVDIITEPLGDTEDISKRTNFANDIIIEKNDIFLGVFGVIIKTESNVTIQDNMLSHLSCNPIYLYYLGLSYVNNNYFEGNWHIYNEVNKDMTTDPILVDRTVTAANANLLAKLPGIVKAQRAYISIHGGILYAKNYIGSQYFSNKFVRTKKTDIALNNSGTSVNLNGIDSLINVLQGNAVIEDVTAQDMTTESPFKYHIIKGTASNIVSNIKDCMVYEAYPINASNISCKFINSPSGFLSNTFPARNYYLDNTDTEQDVSFINKVIDIVKEKDFYLTKLESDGVFKATKIPLNKFVQNKTYKASIYLKNISNANIEGHFKIVVKDTQTIYIKDFTSISFNIIKNSCAKYTICFDLNGIDITDTGNVYFQFSTSDHNSIYASNYIIEELGSNVEPSDILPTGGYVFKATNIPVGEAKILLNDGREAVWSAGNRWMFGQEVVYNFGSETTFWAYRYNKVGTTRPNILSSYDEAGFQFFDKTEGINKPIWWNGTTWIDATGTPV